MAELDGFLPGRHLIDAYGNGGFRFGEMSHRGSILALPSGVSAWAIARSSDLTEAALDRVFAEAASIDLLLSGDWAATIARINSRLTEGLAPLRGAPGVYDVRTIGAVGVVQLDHPVDVRAATDAALAEGVWLRPFRDLVYTMPPYVCSDDDVARIAAALDAAAAAG